MENQLPTILVIEDDTFISTYLEDKLKERFRTVLVTNTKDAREELSSKLVSLIILDILLPQEDGFTFLEEIKEKKSPHNDIPVIILSNFGQPDYVQKGLALGAVEYLVKANYSPDEIADRIQALLMERQTDHEH